MKNLVGALVALVVIAGASRGVLAAASDAGVESEPGLVAKQAFSGMGIAMGGLMLTGVTAPAGPLAVVPIAGTPWGIGLAVCGYGKRSRYYEGSCTASIVGAYVGMLSVIPLAMLGYQMDVDAGGEEFLDGLLGMLAGATVGWVIVQPLVSTAAWHVTKQPRLQIVAPPVVRTRTRAPGQMTLTLLRAGF